MARILRSLGLICLCLCGCTYHISKDVVRRNSYSSQTETSIQSKYEYLDGCEEYHVTFDEDSSIHVDIQTIEGKIGLKIESENGTIEYRGNDLGNSQFIVDVKKGSYILTINANQHKGRYELCWDENV